MPRTSAGTLRKKFSTKKSVDYYTQIPAENEFRIPT